MRLWFAHSSEVPIYRQVVTQVVLAILCADLRPGDRVPSTRELARRFAPHPNTVNEVEIAHKNISGFSYTTELAPHLGVLPAIAVGLASEETPKKASLHD